MALSNKQKDWLKKIGYFEASKLQDKKPIFNPIAFITCVLSGGHNTEYNTVVKMDVCESCGLWQRDRWGGSA